jgi:peptidylprolyl isomerase
VNYFRSLQPNSARALFALALLAAAIAVAGCGSSSSGSSTITIGNENTHDNALASSGNSEEAKTPASGPLSKEPSIARPTTAPPKKLETKDLILGSGSEAKPGQTITVNYVGMLYKTGKIFDSSWKRKEPFSFTLGRGQVIKGWDKGIVGMKVGGRRVLVIPPELAYGKKGSGSTIPPNSTLLFVVDLLGT